MIADGRGNAGAGRHGDARQHVLVVDDDPGVRALLRRLLEEEGLRVELVEDGQAALDVLDRALPDLVLLDLGLPKVGGLEVCRRVKADPERRLIPVVLITGRDARGERIEGIEAGADDFLAKPFDRPELIARVRSLLRGKRYTDELDRAESVLMALGTAVEERDPYTIGHCRRLAEMAARLGNRLGLSAAATLDLQRGGYLHDIGKITIPDGVLRKTGDLTQEEWRIMRGHPVAGERICRGLRSLQTVLPIIRHHHERMDGSGYPDGLAGDEIPLGARVLQIVDIYDALVTDRPYKPAMEPAAALETMAEEVERGWWDVEIFDEFRAMIAEGDGEP